MKEKFNKSYYVFVVVAVALLFFATGCGTSKIRETFSSPFVKEEESVPSYQDFSDILLPQELEIIKKSTFVYNTPAFTGGVVSLKGRVEVRSLLNFFVNNMSKDNWKMVTRITSPKSMLLFQKPTRWAVINISETDFTTYVDIWVAPNVTGTESSLDR